MNANAQDLHKECEAVLAEHQALDRCVAIEGRRREGHQADTRLVFADRSWLQSERGSNVIDAFHDHPLTHSAQRRKSTIHIRFDDQVLADLEHRLAAGERAGMDLEDVFVDHRVTVSYVGPNTNKALHVGHLRNIVLGEALASACAAAGIAVRRHNLVGDIGRRVGEAMAGYQTFYRDKHPDDEGLPGDRFVELCTGEYSRELSRAMPDREDADPNAEEKKALGDLADKLMNNWLREADEEMRLWEQMREWVLDSHRDTLARLGVTMDHQDFESGGIPRAAALIDDGVASGILERESSGAVVYRTERSEYPTMVLIREDGFPTEHGRLLGVYDQILEGLAPGEAYVEVAGTEWQPSIMVLRELLGRLRPGPRNEADIRAFHASVTSPDGEKIGSSVGDVVWIDDFLDAVTEGPAVSALEELSEGTASREELADILIRGTFLCTPTVRPLPFAQEPLIEGGSGPGRTIAEAWCHARLAQESEGNRGPTARTAVIQSQQYRRSLRRAVEKHDATSLARYLLNLAESYLAAPDPGPAAAPVMARVLHSLGFVAGNFYLGLEDFDTTAAQSKVAYQ